MTTPLGSARDRPRDGRPRAISAAHLALVLLFAWLYGGDVALWAKVRSSPVSALVEPPGLVLPVLGLVLAAAGLGLLSAGLARARTASWRGYRLFPVAAVVVLFADFGVLSSVKVAMPSVDRALVAVQIFSDFATANATDGKVPREPKALEPVLMRLGPSPWLAHGRPTAWRIDVRAACGGPAADAAGQPAGTLIYCVASDHTRAWVTVVGLPVAERFGEAQVVSTDAAWVGEVAPRPADDEALDTLPTPFERE